MSELQFGKLQTARDTAGGRPATDFLNSSIQSKRKKLYVHSPEELPYLLMPEFKLHKSGAHMHYSLNIIEVFNYPDIKEESIEKRECQYPYENITQELPYSFTNCFLYHRVRMELEVCNCTIPTSPKEYSTYFCDIEGLICISKGYLKSFKSRS
ncbi:uncharacterized protein LOC131693766 isoform X2 [Topomyia yanbarensis]|uniref:uncharacterized protein LOC131693766 isoform X2 n=1 Tax=Topomyia yanbarensis TaxID=2498891 RepID=UPI00273B310F|nr:uncharacterized protein LOC131693766 isoform X2 [Topomyia yanbarensis]